MNAVEVSCACDELHQAIDQGPGNNPGVYATSLSIIGRLKAAAGWDYPVTLLGTLEIQMARWLKRGSSSIGGDDEVCRAVLLGLISKIEEAWERPRD
jgi:hypothetical protein